MSDLSFKVFELITDFYLPIMEMNKKGQCFPIPLPCNDLPRRVYTKEFFYTNYKYEKYHENSQLNEIPAA